MKVEIRIVPECEEPKIVIHTPVINEEIEALVRQLSAPETIAAHTGRGVELIGICEIIRVYSERQKVFIQTASGVYPVRHRLYEMEQQLSGSGFVRISGSELVCVRMITGMDFSLTGTIRLSLKGEITTYVSRRRVSEIKKLFDL